VSKDPKEDAAMYRSTSRAFVAFVLFVVFGFCTLVLHSPKPAIADFATPFVGIHNQVGDVSKARGYVVALSNDENPSHYLVVVATDVETHVVIRATAAKNVVPPGLLGRPVIVEGKITKRDEDEKTRQVTVELEILSVERPEQKRAQK